MHSILKRQLKRYFGEHIPTSPQWKDFIESVDKAYTDFDEDQALLDRSLEISSKEFLENSQLLRASRAKVEEQAHDLVQQVSKRTKELNTRVKELENARRAMANLLEDLERTQEKEEVLTKDLEKFKLAVDNVSDNIIITDTEGIVIYVNKAIEGITGYKPAEIIGKKSGALWKSPMSPEYYQKLWDTIRKQKKVFNGELQNRRRNGEIYTASIGITPILNKKGEIEFFVGIERDITKEKEIDNAKTEFVSMASHALRTPLTAIDGLVSMILDGEYGKVNRNLKQPLEDVATSSERLIHLVNDLLNLSRIQAGRMKYVLSEFPIADTISEVIHLLQPLAKQKGLQLTATKAEADTVLADEDKVKEILNNLIGNSLKFTNSGNITISTKTAEDKIEIYVADTGIGITEEDRRKLFGLFQQLRSAPVKSTTIGTGLGLHISKQMVAKMGGDLWIEKSEVGKGSVFAFSLPAANSELAKRVREELKKEAKEHPDQKSNKIEPADKIS